MKKFISFSVALTTFVSFFIAPIVVNAQQVHPVDVKYRVQLTDFTTEGVTDLRTDGEAIYWWDLESRQIVIYTISTNQFALLPADEVYDLNAGGQWAVYKDEARSDGFLAYSTITKETTRIETEKPVDGITCMNDNSVAYRYETELYVYSFLTGESQFISDTINGNHFFCSLFDRYISYNDIRTGESEVYLYDQIEKEDIILSKDLEGRSSVIIWPNVYYTEQENIYVYNIVEKTTELTPYRGKNLTGYLGGTGIEFLSFNSSFENGLASIYLAMPQLGYLYRMSNVDRFVGIHDFWNGIMTWTEFQDGKMAVYGSNFKLYDSDSDLLTDAEEIIVYGTNPFNSDSDGDGYSDRTEIENGYSPLDIAPSPVNNDSSPEEVIVNNDLIDRVSGKILLQVESRGEAWYVDPVSRKRYYLKDGQAGYQIMRKFGLGITNNDLSKIPDDGEPAPQYLSLAKRLAGRILLQVEENGEAWYVWPDSYNKQYLRDGNATYQLMRNWGLGISNADLAQIPIGEL